MKIILLENIKGLGQIGDIKEAKNGYAKNFLIPRKLAKLATKGALKEIGQLKMKLERLKTETAKKAQEIEKKLKDFVLEIKSKTTKTNTLYAAISKQKINNELKKQGIKIEEENILLDEPIKKVGEYEIKIRLEPDIEAVLKLNVVGK